MSQIKPRYISRSSQQGVTLFLIVIILIVITSLAAVVVSNSRLGLNSVSFTKEKFVNEQELLGVSTDILRNEITTARIMGLTEPDSAGIDTRNDVSVLLNPNGDSYCQRSAQASSVNIIRCKLVRADFTQDNNRRVNGLAMSVGIEQPFLVGRNK